MDTRHRVFAHRLWSLFRGSGFDLSLVGGALRDELLGHVTHELDFATNAHPDQIIALLETLPDVSIYRVGAKFGTIGAIEGGLRAEITTYRSAEQYEPRSRKPVVEFGGSLEEDLSRRDFTINAMAIDAGAIAVDPGGEPATGVPVRLDGELARLALDPFGGRADLLSRTVRAVGTPSERFHEDPLRILRGLRFAAALDFEVHPATWLAMKEAAPTLSSVSRERIADEVGRMLTGPIPNMALTLMRDSGVLAVTMPRLLELTRMADHGPSHPLSLWDHTMAVVAGTRPDLITRWAALLHDIGKPRTRSFDPGGRIRFHHHEELGAREAESLLQSLRLGNELITSVRELVATHMQLHAYSEEWSDGAVRRLCERLGRNFDRAIDLALADARGHGETAWGVSKVEALRTRAENLMREVPEIGSPLDGRELMARYHRTGGPWITRVKDALTDLVREGQLRYDDTESAWREADRIVGALSQEAPGS